jgi:hypothetical protein
MIKKRANNKVGFIDFNAGSNIETKFVEVNNKVKKYYGLLQNDDGGMYVLDYEGTSRFDAQAYFEAEGFERGHRLTYVGVY